MRQLEQTLNRDLVIPYVNFNFGKQERYPKLRIKYVEPKNVQLIVDSVTKLVPLGFKVKAQEMHALLGLSSPEKDDEVLTAPAAYEPMINAQRAGRIALNASDVTQGENDEIDDDEAEGFIEITDDIAAVIEKAADTATDFKSFEAELEKLVSGWDAGKIARTMAIAFFKARAEGDANFAGEE